MDNEQIIVVQETEYTGAGKHILPQLTFAKNNGIEVKVGNPLEEVPGENLILPEHPSMMLIKDMKLDNYRNSFIKNSLSRTEAKEITNIDFQYLCDETKLGEEKVSKQLESLGIKIGR